MWWDYGSFVVELWRFAAELCFFFFFAVWWWDYGVFVVDLWMFCGVY